MKMQFRLITSLHLDSQQLSCCCWTLTPTVTLLSLKNCTLNYWTKWYFVVWKMTIKYLLQLCASLYIQKKFPTISCHKSHKWRSTEKNRTIILRRWSEKEGCDDLVMLREWMKYAFRSKRCTGKLQDSGEDLAGRGLIGEMWWRNTSKEWDWPAKRGWSINWRQTFVASTYGAMHWWCWMNQVKSTRRWGIESNQFKLFYSAPINWPRRRTI